ncbi:alpha-1B adrenergic receptor-like [Amphiura filiformis]|uniref:alpha-1B adrenergic receptor-like n=1 Tax=Amphiura filiformis TaxID=82378 RepID=UPI003B223E31
MASNVLTSSILQTVSTTMHSSPSDSDSLNTTMHSSPGGRDFVFDNIPERLTIGIITLIISMVGIFGNSLTIFAVFLSRKLRTITNVFVVNLAVADLLTCMVLPWNAVGVLYPPSDEYPLPDMICKFAALVLYTCAGCSVYTLAAISINRYFLITRQSKRYRAFYSRTKMATIVTVVWIWPLLVALVPPLCGLGELGFTAKYSSCTHDTSHPLSDYYSMLQAALLFPVPLTIIVVCYVKVFLHLKSHHRNMKDQVNREVSENASVSQASLSNRHSVVVYPTPTEKRKQLSRRQVEITKNLFYVVVVFLICILPYGICLMIPPSDPLIPWVATIFLLNSCLNWMIYATKHPHFKTVYRLILNCQCAKIPEQSAFLRSFRSTFAR